MIEPKVSKAKIDQSKKIVGKIVTHHFGAGRSTKIEHMSSGKTNLVFSVRHSAGEFVIRLGAQPEKITSFLKEQWAIGKARERDVPTPDVLYVGIEAAKGPYMISRQSKGTEASFHHDRKRIVKQMGRCAATIHSIRTSGFGSAFEWSQNSLSQNATWSEYLQNELKMDEAIETLQRLGMLGRGAAGRLRKALKKAAGKDRAPALNHGDLRLKNLLVDESGEISCILDWEHCTSNLAPEWDFALAMHDLSIDDKQEFLSGYGIGGKELIDLSSTLKALTLVNYAPSLERAMDAKNREEIEWYRARLHGAFDFYTL